MNIKGNGDVSQLVRALNDSTVRESRGTRTKGEQAADSGIPAQSADAVRIDQGFGSGATASEVSSRVATLKEQVARGEYNPRSEDVAAAVFKELFV